MHALSDEEFEVRALSLLMKRDERAFSELVRRYERRVFSLIVRMIGNPGEADELTQEVFLQVFKSLDSFRGESKLSTWIFRIAVNTCKNRIKYLRVRRDGEHDAFDDVAERLPEDASPKAQGNVTRPDVMLEQNELRELVRQAILKLDEDFRECLVLRDVEELSYEEIGAITGLAEGTVKSRIFRARQMLREMLERALGRKMP